MAIKITSIWPPDENGGRRIPVLKLEDCAVLGNHVIFRSEVWHRLNGETECWLWNVSKDSNEEIELLSIIRMECGGELQIQRNDGGTNGVKFYDKDGTFLEFAPFSDDGNGLKCDQHYQHISVDPAYSDQEAQLVKVS